MEQCKHAKNHEYWKTNRIKRKRRYIEQLATEPAPEFWQTFLSIDGADIGAALRNARSRTPVTGGDGV